MNTSKSSQEPINCRLLEKAKIEVDDKVSRGTWKVATKSQKVRVATISAEMSIIRKRLGELRFKLFEGQKGGTEVECKDFPEIFGIMKKAGLILDATTDDQIWDELYAAIPQESKTSPPPLGRKEEAGRGDDEKEEEGE